MIAIQKGSSNSSVGFREQSSNGVRKRRIRESGNGSKVWESRMFRKRKEAET